MKVEAGDEVLTLQQAAERLGMSAATLRLQVRNGKLDATLAGKTYLVTAADLERYRRDHRGRYGFASPDHPGRTSATSAEFKSFYILYPRSRRDVRAKAMAWAWWRANVRDVEVAVRIAKSAEIARSVFGNARQHDRHLTPTMGEWLVGEWWWLDERQVRQKWKGVRAASDDTEHG